MKLFRLRKRQDGSVVIEFAIIFPILFLLIVSMIEYALIFYTEALLEGTMADLARFSRIELVKSIEDGTVADFEDKIKERVEENSFGIARAERLVITSDVELAQDQAYSQYNTEYCIDPASVDNPTVCSEGATPCTGNRVLDDINANGRCDVGEAPPLDIGRPGDIVSYRLIYKWDVISPIISAMAADDQGNVLIGAVGVMRNEK